jgi:hypothetical protein
VSSTRRSPARSDHHPHAYTVAAVAAFAAPSRTPSPVSPRCSCACRGVLMLGNPCCSMETVTWAASATGTAKDAGGPFTTVATSQVILVT